MASEFMQQIYSWINIAFERFFTNFIIATIILLVGFVIGRIFGRIIQKVLHEVELDRIVKSATRFNIPLEHLIASFVSYFIYFIFIIVALEKLGIGTIAFNLLAAGIMIIIIISIFLGIKDFVPNAMSGIVIHSKKIVNEGEVIKFKDIEGKVIHVNLIETRIETKAGDIIHIPNSNLTKTEITKIRNNKKN